METAMTARPRRKSSNPRPAYELLLVIGLLVAALLASAVTIALALDHGFTRLPGIERLIGR